MYAKYEVSIPYGLKGIARVKIDNRQKNKQTERQTYKQIYQKQCAPDHSIQGHKNVLKSLPETIDYSVSGCVL